MPKVVGTYDGLEVWGTRFFKGYDTFAFRNDDELLAFIVIHESDNNLACIWVNEKYRGKGYATALILFLLEKLNLKLRISKDGKLTHDSWDWLIKSVTKNRFKVIDETTNEIVSIDKLKREKIEQILTNTSLLLVGMKKNEQLFGIGWRVLNEMRTFINNSDYE